MSHLENTRYFFNNKNRHGYWFLHISNIFFQLSHSFEDDICQATTSPNSFVTAWSKMDEEESIASQSVYFRRRTTEHVKYNVCAWTIPVTHQVMKCVNMYRSSNTPANFCFCVLLAVILEKKIPLTRGIPKVVNRIRINPKWLVVWLSITQLLHNWASY